MVVRHAVIVPNSKLQNETFVSGVERTLKRERTKTNRTLMPNVVAANSENGFSLLVPASYSEERTSVRKLFVGCVGAERELEDLTELSSTHFFFDEYGASFLFRKGGDRQKIQSKKAVALCNNQRLSDGPCYLDAGLGPYSDSSTAKRKKKKEKRKDQRIP
jgi:hypothetical protein